MVLNTNDATNPSELRNTGVDAVICGRLPRLACNGGTENTALLLISYKTPASITNDF
jgi:hypothetical protein